MMNLTLTYDHRLIDGREAATFLMKVRIPGYNNSIFEAN
jgi:pyruvate/2-oxoglutarate dehydrogenase complex dihydrolipoamide acyltransferase (E2) component